MEDLAKGVRAYFDDERFSDFQVICGTSGRVYKTHRFLLSSQSKWFERCCSNGLQETGERCVTLKDDKPGTLSRLMQFFYTFEYDGTNTADDDELRHPLELHAWMLVIGDKYEVPGLKRLALKKLKIDLLEQMTETEAISNAAAIVYDHVHANGDQAAHRALVAAWINGGKARVQLDTDKMCEIMKSNPRFAVNIQERLLGDLVVTGRCPRNCDTFVTIERKSGKKVTCRTCGTYFAPEDQIKYGRIMMPTELSE